tara:strand:- start:16184 stop:16426 length:243 start_codon:yes stop_codon:yes gene_type:complete
MAKDKKPTMMEVKKAVNTLIHQQNELMGHLSVIDKVVGNYIRYNKDEESFKKWLNENIKEEEVDLEVKTKKEEEESDVAL